MLPEAWWPETQDTSTCSLSRRPSRRSPVTDILVWVECYSMMAAVLAGKYPDKAPQLLAYRRRIVHAARNFHGSAWVAYDRVYRRQALARRSLEWAQEDSALYNEAFVGHAKVIVRCRHCLSEYHATEACPDLPHPPALWPTHYLPTSPTAASLPPGHRQELCRKFNDNRCFIRRCKYVHACSNCGRPHPAALCSSTSVPPRQLPQGRERSPMHPFQDRQVRILGQRS